MEAKLNMGYAISKRGRDLFFYTTGRSRSEVFDNFGDLLEEEGQEVDGVCEVKCELHEEQKNLFKIIGRGIIADSMIPRL